MAITKIADLRQDTPANDEDISLGAGRIREIIEALQNQFPGFSLALSNEVTDDWLNQLAERINIVGGNIDVSNSRILNLTSGQFATDAVNYGQLAALEAKVTSLEARITALESNHP